MTAELLSVFTYLDVCLPCFFFCLFLGVLFEKNRADFENSILSSPPNSQPAEFC